MSYIIIGLLGGIVVGMIIYIKSFIQEKQFERNFSISGRYLTKYEDEKDGEIVTFTAPAEFKQKGNKINGYTYLSEGGQKWIIEGRISSDGYFYGIYHAVGIIDKGIGNFFLKVDKNRNMLGIWSGFDAANNKINSGKYMFMPQFNTKIEEIASEHIPYILALSDQQLGENYLNNDILDIIIKDKNNYFGKVVIDSNNKVIGFYLCYIIESTQLESLLNITTEKVPSTLKSSGKIGVLKTIVISEKYRGRGIGTILVKDSIDEFKKHKIKTICSIAWKNKNRINIGGILKKLGFVQMLEIQDYWKEDSIKKDYSCPACGGPPCKCFAVIFDLVVGE